MQSTITHNDGSKKHVYCQFNDLYRLSGIEEFCQWIFIFLFNFVSQYSWLLYEKPDFQGRSIAFEEGAIELNNVWAESGLETEPQHSPPIQIGSIRLAVCVSVLNEYFSLTGPSVFQHLQLCHLIWSSEAEAISHYYYWKEGSQRVQMSTNAAKFPWTDDP